MIEDVLQPRGVTMTDPGFVAEVVQDILLDWLDSHYCVDEEGKHYKVVLHDDGSFEFRPTAFNDPWVDPVGERFKIKITAEKIEKMEEKEDESDSDSEDDLYDD